MQSLLGDEKISTRKQIPQRCDDCHHLKLAHHINKGHICPSIIGKENIPSYTCKLETCPTYHSKKHTSKGSIYLESNVSEQINHHEGSAKMHEIINRLALKKQEKKIDVVELENPSNSNNPSPLTISNPIKRQRSILDELLDANCETELFNFIPFENDKLFSNSRKAKDMLEILEELSRSLVDLQYQMSQAIQTEMEKTQSYLNTPSKSHQKTRIKLEHISIESDDDD